MSIPYKFVQLKPLNPFDSVTSEHWPVLTEYDHTQANIRPVEATTIELDAEIERLKNDAAFHKQTLINYQNETQARIDDYRNLEVDYLNSQGEVKRLKAQLEFFDGLEQYNLWLMKQYLELKNKSVEDKKEVDRTWL